MSLCTITIMRWSAPDGMNNPNPILRTLLVTALLVCMALPAAAQPDGWSVNNPLAAFSSALPSSGPPHMLAVLNVACDDSKSELEWTTAGGVGVYFANAPAIPEGIGHTVGPSAEKRLQWLDVTAHIDGVPETWEALWLHGTEMLFIEEEGAFGAVRAARSTVAITVPWDDVGEAAWEWPMAGAADAIDESCGANQQSSGNEEPEAPGRWDDNGDGKITCAEARRHGIAPVRRGHPAYPLMRDPDGDGVVCG